MADPLRYHIYVDQTNFEMKVRVMRMNRKQLWERGTMKEKIEIEKYNLYVCGSFSSLPRTSSLYWTLTSLCSL